MPDASHPPAVPALLLLAGAGKRPSATILGHGRKHVMRRRRREPELARTPPAPARSRLPQPEQPDHDALPLLRRPSLRVVTRMDEELDWLLFTLGAWPVCCMDFSLTRSAGRYSLESGSRNMTRMSVILVATLLSSASCSGHYCGKDAPNCSSSEVVVGEAPCLGCCTIAGSSCTQNSSSCCSGTCTNSGVCGCGAAGTPCGSGSDCCSGVCGGLHQCAANDGGQ